MTGTLSPPSEPTLSGIIMMIVGPPSVSVPSPNLRGNRSFGITLPLSSVTSIVTSASFAVVVSLNLPFSGRGLITCACTKSENTSIRSTTAELIVSRILTSLGLDRGRRGTVHQLEPTVSVGTAPGALSARHDQPRIHYNLREIHVNSAFKKAIHSQNDDRIRR